MESTERKPPSRGIEVRLLDHTSDPTRSLYIAYRTAYSSLTPMQIAARIEDERITREQMLDFIQKRLQTGHASPLEQAWFEFGISGVSRAFSHQFVRHRMGISFEQQSQRYVTFKGGEFPYTVPESVKKEGFEEDYRKAFDDLAKLYDRMITKGVLPEDARFVLPNATNTNFKVTVNLLEFLHIADLRLCTRAQWEFRKVVAMMRAELMRKFPELALYVQPKCGEHRLGYCDEAYEDWKACPLGGNGGKRPHKDELFKAYARFAKRLYEYEPQYGSGKKESSKADLRFQLDFFETFGEEAKIPVDTPLMIPDDWVKPEDMILPAPLDEADFEIIEREESST